MTKAAGLVFVPAPAIGHIVSTIELAKRLVARDERFSVTVLIIPSPFDSAIQAYTQAIIDYDPRIKFINIPPAEKKTSSSKSQEESFSLFLESHKAHITHAITTSLMSDDSVPLIGIVFDQFCSFMIDVGYQFGIPSYLFVTTCASYLGLVLYLPVRHNQVGAEFDPLDTESIIPSYLNPVPTSVLPSFVFCKDGYQTLLNQGKRFMEATGIIVNSCTELEPYALKSIKTPPLYAIGPLLDVGGLKHPIDSGPKLDEITMWLSDQQPSSVVFLCFGSVFGFSAPQIEQIAMALEASGQHFLWSIRWPPPTYSSEPIDCPSTLQEVLPEGFLKRTQEIGMVCGWAPQVEVLAHPAIGGFVSHCGWNSILESLWNGVPVATWPLYAEQQINAFELVHELGLAIELKMDSSLSDGKVVMADEIERAIHRLMVNENPLRKKVKEMSTMSRSAVMEGGSSFASFGRLIEDMLGNNIQSPSV